MPDTVGELQLVRLREMSVEEKLSRLDALFSDAHTLVEAGVRLRRPDLLGRAFDDEVRRVFDRVES